MNLSSRLQTLLPKKRWQRLSLEAALIVAVILGAQYWQTRGLPEGAAPPLAGVLTNGQTIKVPGGTHSAGAGDTANGAPTLVASGRRGARCAQPRRATSFPWRRIIA
jgi:hypothetical protein